MFLAWPALLAVTPAEADANFAVIRNFGGSDGEQPNAALYAAPDGSLFGTAQAGGTTSKDDTRGGVAFQLVKLPTGTGWSRTIIHRFGLVTADGSSPHSRLTPDRDGNLYGTTYLGGGRGMGTVFRLAPPLAGATEWQETVLYSFTGQADGGHPLAGVVVDRSGALYGTALDGGSADQGVVYRLTPPAAGTGSWSQTVLHSFVYTDGAQPRGDLLPRTVGGAWTLIGTTTGGGAIGLGTVFSLTAPADGQTAWGHTILHSFLGGTDGAAPLAGVIADRSMTLFGTTSGGGVVGLTDLRYGGTVFRLTPPAQAGGTWTATNLYSFKGGPDGRFPIGGVVERADGRLFGTTAGLSYGGCTANCGTVYMLTSNGGVGRPGPWKQKVLHVFSGFDGDVPSADLAALTDATGATSYYGVTERGGAKNLGAVFKQTP